jgi:hypothetical protein
MSALFLGCRRRQQVDDLRCRFIGSRVGNFEILGRERVTNHGQRKLRHAKQLGLKSRCGQKGFRHNRDGRDAALFEFN